MTRAVRSNHHSVGTFKTLSPAKVAKTAKLGLVFSQFSRFSRSSHVNTRLNSAAEGMCEPRSNTGVSSTPAASFSKVQNAKEVKI